MLNALCWTHRTIWWGIGDLVCHFLCNSFWQKLWVISELFTRRGVHNYPALQLLFSIVNKTMGLNMKQHMFLFEKHISINSALPTEVELVISTQNYLFYLLGKLLKIWIWSSALISHLKCFRRIIVTVVAFYRKIKKTWTQNGVATSL